MVIKVSYLLGFVIPTLLLPLLSSPGFAFSFTHIDYNESNKKFEWKFKINDVSDQGEETYSPNDDDLWSPIRLTRANPDRAGSSTIFALQGMHDSKVHDEDFEIGAPFDEFFDINNLAPGEGTVFKKSVPHFLTTGGQHSDIYTLTYTKNENEEPIEFVFTGKHVPEPATIFGSATAFGFGALLKRRNSKNKNKSLGQ